MSLRDEIIRRIHADGPLTFAEYMALALYHPELGYYARAARRTGSAGDFVTSVDYGTLFGELLAKQFAQMADILGESGPDLPSAETGRPIDLVEVGAGDGRLTRAILDEAARAYPAFYAAVRCTLVERSATARAQHQTTLAPHLARLAASQPDLPDEVTGIIFANELLDALPVHAVVMTPRGLREVYVDLVDDRLMERLGPPSPSVVAYMDRQQIKLQPGWRAEVSPDAVSWVDDAGRRLNRGFLVCIDYGHDSRELYSPTHAAGTLAVYRRHRVEARGETAPGSPRWLDEPGSCDITAHVDLTAVSRAAAAAGLETLAVLDQSYFLLALADQQVTEDDPHGLENLKRRLAFKTLIVPGGLGSTHKVMLFGKSVGCPTLAGCTFAVRTT